MLLSFIFYVALCVVLCHVIYLCLGCKDTTFSAYILPYDAHHYKTTPHALLYTSTFCRKQDSLKYSLTFHLTILI